MEEEGCGVRRAAVERRWPRATPNEPRSPLQLIFDCFVGGGRTGLGLILTLFNHIYGSGIISYKILTK